MTPPLRILYLEDDPRDADLVQEVLEAEGIICQITRVETRADFVASLEQGGFALILADYALPSFDGMSALTIASKRCPHVPFIFVSGTLGEEVAVESLKIGATDYVRKTLLSRIAPSVQRALREARERMELSRAAAALRRSEAYLAEAQRLSHTGSFGWNVSSGEIYWSDEIYRMVGVDQASKPSFERVYERIHPDDRALVRHSLDCAFRDGTDADFEHRFLMPEGSVKYVRVLAKAMRDESGELEYIGAVIDLTNQKLAQAERERLEQRLRQAEKMEAVGRLAGGIAHDFNGVLAGVYAYGEMLVEEAPAGSPLKRYAQNVLTAASRGRELVEQILTYSRSQHGKREPVDIARVVTEALELVRGSIPAGVRLGANGSESPLVVTGDATRLHQVVMNLCSNAIQAMSGAGSLYVALEATDISTERALSHGTLRSGRYVRLTVKDNGSGMDEATLSRIFEPFFTTKETGQGTGLGLSLVYAIVTDSGGAIDVRSAPGQGSTFTIYLPHSPVTLVAAEAATAASHRGHGERVLLIDDEAPVLAATAEVLSRLGYEAVSFSDSHAALAAFEAAPQRFDVVVTDETMPGLTGTGLARMLRSHRPDLPIVLMSGYTGAIQTQQALATGVSELLSKPIQSHEMATTLARVLRRSA
jgi:signal transduction histidine kinase/DNA-binding response OmpR family regulator